ncbi:M3 family metallopeptidase [Sphingomonas sp. MMS24-JH45]
MTISTDYPDFVPVMSYARSEPLRCRLYEAFLTRAWPQNDAVLRDLLSRRDTLATLLGRPNYAALALEDKMVDTPAKVQAFMAGIATAGEGYARADLARTGAGLGATSRRRRPCPRGAPATCRR